MSDSLPVAPPSPRTPAGGRVRTRFAPSPTGFLHIGGARTALFSWAFARHAGGTFVLRIEDTDVQRSSQAAVDGILAGMSWLGLEADEGPFYQMQRVDRYREVIAAMLAAGTAYHCYCTPAELDEMREAQRAAGLKPRYDGRWRLENAVGRTPPADVKPVVRFRNPLDGVVTWDDLVKGPISIANTELDDLIIARSDGTPTYNFCVVVDDWDMRISHVIRGDDHVNNTPRQINILRALGGELPVYGHVPMINGPDGEKLSKRHGAVSVMQYEEDGYLPEAIINYLARLGWSHGDDEVFTREQLVGWFDGGHLSRSPAQFDFDKLRWLNNLHLRQTDDAVLAADVARRLARRGLSTVPEGAAVGFELDLAAVCALYKDRAQTLEELTDAAQRLLCPPEPSADELAARLDETARGALAAFIEEAGRIDWQAAPIAAAIKTVVSARKIKMPVLALPARLLVFGTTQTPSIDAMLALLPREVVLARLGRHLG